MTKHNTVQERPFTDSVLDGDNPRTAVEEVTSNIVAFERLERSAAGLKLFSRMVVEGIPGSVDRILLNAMFAAGIPRFGEVHRLLGIPVNRLSVQMAPDSTKDAFVDIQYGVDTAEDELFDQDPDNPNAPPRLEVASTLVPARTELEFGPSGVRIPIIVDFLPEPVPGQTAPELQTQSGSAEYMKPVAVVRFYRRERDDPLLKARRFQGHLNSSAVFGDPPRTWLITRLAGVTVDRGETWNVTYEFQQGIDVWDPDVFFTDSSGRRHKDATIGNGIRQNVRVMPQVNFHLLNLVF